MRMNWNLNVWAIIVYSLVGFQLLDFNITWFQAKILLQISYLNWIKWDSYLYVEISLSSLRSGRCRGS